MVFSKVLSVGEALRAPSLRVVAAGCSHRLEQHILQQSNYFKEWVTMLPHTRIDLCMIGPEMRPGAGAASPTWTEMSNRLRYTISEQTLGEFLEVRCRCCC